MTTTHDLDATPPSPDEPLDDRERTDPPAASDEELEADYRPTQPSLKPALVVIACVLAVTFGGIAMALLGGSSATSTPLVGLGKPVPGVDLQALPAAGALRRITSGGQPPSDIIRSLVVPAGVTVTGSDNHDADVDQFDEAVTMTTTASQRELIDFYRVELVRGRWSLLGNYPLAQGGTELLARRASVDGYEWEVGLVVTPARDPSISPALAGGSQTAPTTSLELRLFQVSDEN